MSWEHVLIGYLVGTWVALISLGIIEVRAGGRDGLAVPAAVALLWLPLLVVGAAVIGIAAARRLAAGAGQLAEVAGRISIKAIREMDAAGAAFGSGGRAIATFEEPMDKRRELPGWPVPVFGGRLRNGYHLREDTDRVYLVYGSEEIVTVLTPAKDVTVRQIEDAMNEDADDRVRKTAALRDRAAL